MDGTRAIRQGMDAYTSDERKLGTVEKVEPAAIHVNGRHIEDRAIARVKGNRVYLAGTYAELAGGVAAQAEQGALRVPVMEERLDVAKRQVEQGEVTLHKTVTEEQVTVPVELRREEIHVEQRDIKDRPIDPATMADAFKEGTIRVPVRGEEAVVTKQVVQTGEVAITKEQTVERQQITDTVRRERVKVDENYRKVRADLEKHFTKTPAAAAGRTFEEVEPSYQQGYAAAADARYAGKTFEEVEPELRERSAPVGAGDDSGWEQLRENVRAGWERARGN